jgi:uncharacterized hydrophobic protein (TIGR00341 family)
LQDFSFIFDRKPNLMSLRVIEITLPAEKKKTILQIAERHKALDTWWTPKNEEVLRTFSILVDRGMHQETLDSLHLHLKDIENWRAVLIPIEGTIPEIEKNSEQPRNKKKFAWRKSLSREELFQEITKGAEGDVIYYAMVILSTIVAAVGLIQDNVAVVIAAMVIAPLLGPNLALAFGGALGNKPLIFNALKTCIGGLGMAVTLSIFIGFFLPVDIQSEQLSSRTIVDYAGIALALASGAAAVLSMATGVSSALVGVMVSVALLPPAAAFGIYLGLGQSYNALQTGILLLTNIVCVGLASQIVLLVMGIRPRTFLEKKEANQSAIVHTSVWIILLILICIVIYFTGS